MESDAAARRADLFAGAAMTAAAALTVLAMAHHPTGAGHGGGGLAQLVHGAMIALLAVIFFGFCRFSLRRGLHNPLVLAGLIAYGLSVGAHVGAATINGFIVPALAAREAPHDLFALLWEANQALARLGVVATSTAFILWSAHLLRAGPVPNRLIALVGIAGGAYPIAALAFNLLSMNVAGAQIVYSAHAAFAILIGLRLASGKFSPA